MRGRALLVGLVLVLGATRPARAESADADRLFEEGRALLERNDAQGACDKFNAAVKLDPTAPGIVLNLGLCYERLGKYATSLVWFRRAQAIAAETQLPADYKAAAEQHTVELAAKVALARVDVSGAPVSVEVQVDGRVVLPADYGRVEVDNDSVIEAFAPGYKPFRQQLTAISRDAGTITIVLEENPTGRRNRIIGVSLAGGGVLTIAASLIYAKSIKDDYDDKVAAFGIDPMTDLDDGDLGLQDDRDAAEKDLRYKGTTIFVIGAGLVAAGVIVYLTAPSPSDDRAPTTALAPVIGPDLVGFGAIGSF